MTDAWKEFWLNPLTGIACGIALGLIVIGMIFLVNGIRYKIKHRRKK